MVELLVVISIIVVLASMLLPAISVVRGAARAAKCVSNLRQLQFANLVYKNDIGYWVPGYRDQGGFSWDSFWLTNADFISNFTDGKVANGSNPSIQRSLFCPLSRPDFTWNSLRLSYGYNCNEDGAPEGQPLQYHPSDKSVVSFIDGLDWNLRRGDLGNYFANGTTAREGVSSSRTTAFRHHRRCNAAFYDGHVASLSYAELNKQSMWRK